MKTKLPTLRHEKKLWRQGYFVIGVDEVGRGSFAGPVVVCAVCFQPGTKRKEIRLLEKSGINDSKKVQVKKREKLAVFIRENSLYSTTSSVNVSFINKYGIAKATRKAMRKAISKIMKNLERQKAFVLADAFHIKYLRGIGLKNQKAIIHGDQISLSIAAASIIAKVERDKFMLKLSKKYPDYKWGRNKGYGTRRHRAAIKKHGPTRLHRTLYLRKLVY